MALLRAARLMAIIAATHRHAASTCHPTASGDTTTSGDAAAARMSKHIAGRGAACSDTSTLQTTRDGHAGAAIRHIATSRHATTGRWTAGDGAAGGHIADVYCSHTAYAIRLYSSASGRVNRAARGEHFACENVDLFFALMSENLQRTR